PSRVALAAASIRTPRLAPWRNSVTTPDEAMNVFDGTQSESTHAPPAPSASTTVTSAPSWAATRAASYPAGPPPMITTRGMALPPNLLVDYRPLHSLSRRFGLSSSPCAFTPHTDQASTRGECGHRSEVRRVGAGWTTRWSTI